jgi:hypothetical protein
MPRFEWAGPEKEVGFVSWGAEPGRSLGRVGPGKPRIVFLFLFIVFISY